MLEFKSVYFSYEKKAKQVLKDINLSIKKGELLAIVGKNGAGKTTLLKHIIGLLRPTKGEIWLNNENIAKKKVSALAAVVGLAFQNPNHQLFAKNVKEELEFGPKNLKIEKEEREELALKIAEDFNISHLLDKNPLELSGGERRIVSIASVLTMGQQVLVLDEPSFGQDYRQKERLGNYFKQLQAKGVTIIIVSHDIDFIFNYIPRVVVLQNGRIVADDTTNEILVNRELINSTDLEAPILIDFATKLQNQFGIESKFDESELIEKLRVKLQKGGSEQ